MSTVTDFLVAKNDLHRTDFHERGRSEDLALEPGQVLLAVDSFAFTANNVTYAVFGEAMRYWDFFPAPEGHGTVPVWGFAIVERSAHPDVAAGERVYGYLPMSTHFVVTAGDVGPGGFVETAAHRAHLSAIYNQYVRCAGDPGYDREHEAEQMLFRVLFLTGWLIDDFLADNRWFGARSVVVSSASSKTSIGLAACLARRGRDTVEVVGLTSHANKPFVEGLGIYHKVVAYDEIASLDATTPTVFVDMAGDRDVTMAVHRHFGENLSYSCSVGGTHWENLAFGVEIPGPTPTLFFAPAQVDKRVGEWGMSGLQQRMGEAWLAFLPQVKDWITIERNAGHEAIRRVYLDTLEGRADPRRGYVLTF